MRGLGLIIQNIFYPYIWILILWSFLFSHMWVWPVLSLMWVWPGEPKIELDCQSTTCGLNVGGSQQKEATVKMTGIYWQKSFSPVFLLAKSFEMVCKQKDIHICAILWFKTNLSSFRHQSIVNNRDTFWQARKGWNKSRGISRKPQEAKWWLTRPGRSMTSR